VNGTTLARIPRDLVVVSGPDATSFLQSLVSQDLDPVAVGESAHTLLLAPQGKLVVDLRAAHVGPDEWWCVCEGGFGEQLAGALARFRIRVKVEIDDRAASTAAIAVHGDGEPLPAAVAGDAALVCVPAPWPGNPGVEIAGDAAAVDRAFAAIVAAGAARISDDEYEASRIEAGVPRQGYDVDEATIPQEAHLERDAVSFTKGCFVGQELVCRIDTRGHVNRNLRRLRSDGPLDRGAAVVSGAREVGAVTSAAGGVALAMLRREVEPGATVTVRNAAGDVEARVEAVVSD
jgi:tRNA-modifying protein YgfZ